MTVRTQELRSNKHPARPEYFNLRRIIPTEKSVVFPLENTNLDQSPHFTERKLRLYDMKAFAQDYPR